MMSFLRFPEDKIIDFDFFRRARRKNVNRVLVRTPSSRQVVIGRTSRLNEECRMRNIVSDGVSLMQRMGGGCAVVLSKGMVTFSVVKKVEVWTSSQDCFSQINNLIIEMLSDLGVRDLCANGISDICIDNQKILGSSLHIVPGMFFYQGSLLCCNDFSIFERYLRHPPREPEYRKARDHRDFLTSLKQEGYAISCEEIISKAYEHFQEHLFSVN